MPGALQVSAAWSWRLLVVAAAGYLVFRVLTRLGLVVLPVLAGLLIAALLRPLVALLVRRRLPRLAAAFVAVLAAVLTVLAVGYFVVDRAIVEWPALLDQMTGAVDRFQASLAAGPLHLTSPRLDQLRSAVTDYLQGHRTAITTGLLGGAGIALELVSGAILAVFIGFFFLYDGERIWRWLSQPLPAERRDRVDAAATAAWASAAGYIRGTLVIASFHGTVIGLVLVGLDVPLVLPLAVLVFVGSFIPLVGAVLFGGLAVIVTLLTKGLVAGGVLLGVLLAENQLEAHVLQPVVMGRAVRLHPLAIALALAAGTVLAGLPGAIVAVPTVAAGYRSVSAYRRAGAGPSAGSRPGGAGSRRPLDRLPQGPGVDG